MDDQARARLIQEHLDAVRELEGQDTTAPTTDQWPPRGYYLLWHVVVGMLVGIVGAMAALLVNVLGSVVVGQHPLKLIQVLLTFPMGQRAINGDSNQGPVLFVGCILFLSTGALYGVIFHLVMSVLFDGATRGKRFWIATLIGLGLWIVNFYLVLSWLQPLLLGGNWIVREIPLGVAALTHLVFAWVMWALGAFGRFDPRVITT